eukprot:1207306-Rhodomonas_salina.1
MSVLEIGLTVISLFEKGYRSRVCYGVSVTETGSTRWTWWVVRRLLVLSAIALRLHYAMPGPDMGHRSWWR